MSSYTSYVKSGVDGSSNASPAKSTSRGHRTPSPEIDIADLTLAELSVRKSKRSRTSKFTVFTDVTNDTPPDPKRTKHGHRSPLAERSLSEHPSPSPSRRQPDAPFEASPNDPFWDDSENYSDVSDAEVVRPMPPLPRLAPVTFFNGTPQDSPTLRRHTGHRTSSTRRTRWGPNLRRPLSMEAYNLLGLDDYEVTSVEILQAWQTLAWQYHPAFVGEEQHEFATMDMKRIDAVKDMLMDPELRKKYHDDGIMP